MPEVHRINYPAKYLLMSEEQIRTYAICEVIKKTKNRTVATGDLVALGRPIYYNGKRIDRLATWPEMKFKRVVSRS